MGRKRIRKLHLQGVRQFRDVTLDFTHPETGEALDRICFIGRNGTGKSTVLELLRQLLGHRELVPDLGGLGGDRAGVEFEDGTRRLLVHAGRNHRPERL